MLEHIPSKDELNRMSREELNTFAAEIRAFLIEKVSRKGGHLAANLGVVELTIALYSVFDFPTDKVIWDVGHQAYTHKILSGRAEGFDTLRDYGGLCGFPKHYESPYDVFDTGHSSTSVSAGLGLVHARDLKGENYSVISVIGDGSMTGGMAFEALNNASDLKSNFIIILNDNDMSISKNVGGMNRYLTGLRSGKGYNRVKNEMKARLSGIPRVGRGIVDAISNVKDSVKEFVIPGGMLFENLGITYLGPVNGHDVESLKKVLLRAKELDRAVLIHVRTKKGKGYAPSENAPTEFHGVNPFDIETGEEVKKSGMTYSKVFGRWIAKAGAKDPEICAITAAMTENVGLCDFSKLYPDRLFDVGIAEQHAVTFAAGLAKGRLRPVVAVFSSFLQRAYDQILHDVCLQDLPVVFAIDRAGIVGRDGETHQGAFDIAFLRPIPNICLMAPRSGEELEMMLEFTREYHHPIAVRYPRREVPDRAEKPQQIRFGKAEILIREKEVALLSFGDMTETALRVHDLLAEKKVSSTVVNMRFVKPWDRETVRNLLDHHSLFVTMEDGVLRGGIGEEIAASLRESGVSVIRVGIPDRFVPQGDIAVLKEKMGMDAGSVTKKILEALGREEG